MFNRRYLVVIFSMLLIITIYAGIFINSAHNKRPSFDIINDYLKNKYKNDNVSNSLKIINSQHYNKYEIVLYKYNIGITFLELGIINHGQFSPILGGQYISQGDKIYLMGGRLNIDNANKNPVNIVCGEIYDTNIKYVRLVFNNGSIQDVPNQNNSLLYISDMDNGDLKDHILLY